MYSSPFLGHHLPNPKAMQILDDGPPQRLYQVWKGRNKFFFGGRIMFGPDASSLFLTLSLILTPVVLFWAFVAGGVIQTFSQGPQIVLISVVLATSIMVLLFLTCARDPGIIPRNRHPPEPDDDISTLSTDWGSTLSSSCNGIPIVKNVTVNGIVVRVKYCQTCMLYRPPRCSHCSICNNCVDRFDHHCPWIGQCIGKRNYRYFFMFVSCTTLLCLLVLVCCSTYIRRKANIESSSILAAIENSPVSGILVVYTFVVCWFVGGLTAFHIYLISTNQTTYENFRYQYDRKMNPYNLGFPGNCMEVFCYKIPKSQINFRETVAADQPAGFSYLESIRMYGGEMEKKKLVDGGESKDTLGRMQRCDTQPHRQQDGISMWDINRDKMQAWKGTEPKQYW